MGVLNFCWGTFYIQISVSSLQQVKTLYLIRKGGKIHDQ